MRPSEPQFHAFSDDEAGVRGVIAIDSLALGPAAGGCRLWHYPDRAAAERDAALLARGMSYKNAMADLPFGGGKAVLLAPLGADRRAAFRAFGRAVEALGGRYVTAEDVGTTTADMRAVREETRHVAGLPHDPASACAGGDPSPWTALGVFHAMEVAVRHRLGAELAEVTVAVQGLGSVGRRLCGLLADAGARLIVADISEARVAEMAALHGALPCAPEQIHAADAHVYAPCALGGALTLEVIERLNAAVVCGAANNQLAEPEVDAALAARDVLYAPDYVVNSGGIINVAAEYLGESTLDVEHRVQAIAPRLDALFVRARTEGVAPGAMADRTAAQRIAQAQPARSAAVPA
ncbi:Glu/Leu/Phe/Val dehydrogenase dimerization domain-containing protein [Sphingosinithalassobacter sp. LHW66-3]|uniref:Glu/Leu/Phe/Val dehydrogenase family protein n=1 Tax=Sphingosinithalassobacter sp. LHW66-3 TaxID=3424718 RepID=UPI003D6AA0DE